MWKLLNNNTLFNLDLTNGKFYNVNEQGWFNDDNGDMRAEDCHTFVEAESFKATLLQTSSCGRDLTIGKEYTIFLVGDEGHYRFLDDEGDARLPHGFNRVWGNIKVNEHEGETEMNNDPIYVVVTNYSVPYLTEGRLYQVDEVDSFGDPQITDDDRDSYDTEAIADDNMMKLYVGDVIKAKLKRHDGSQADLTNGKEYTIHFDKPTGASMTPYLAHFVDDNGDTRCWFDNSSPLPLEWYDIRKVTGADEESNDEEDEEDDKGIIKFRVNSPEHAEKVQEVFDSMGYEFPAGKAPMFTGFKAFLAVPKGAMPQHPYGDKMNMLLVIPDDDHGFSETEGTEINVEWLDPKPRRVEIGGELYSESKVLDALEKAGVSPVA